jgi:hypothetical protein
MGDRTVTVTIRATDSFSDVMRRYQQQIGQSETATRRVGQAAQQTGGLFQSLGGQMTAVFGVASVAAIGHTISTLNTLGREVAFTETRFQALTGTGTGALESLRSATGGVISDMELMRTTTSAIMTGIAEDTTEAGKVISLGMALGGQEGVEKLMQALRNQSYLVLDTVGISASQVRELSEQYRAAGMESAQAFNRAVLEVGERTRETLGDAANAGVTAWGRMGAQLENTKNQLGEMVGFMGEFVALLLEAANIDLGGLFGRKGGLTASVEAALASTPEGQAALARMRRWATAETALEPWSARAGWMTESYGWTERYRAAQEARAAALVPVTGATRMLTGQYNLMQQAYLGTGGAPTTYYTRADADLALDRLAMIETEFERLKAIREATPDLVSESDLTAMESTVASARRFADAMEAGADAWNSMTFAQTLGQTGGGRLGEATDALAEYLRGQGYEADATDPLLLTLDLMSGRETRLSQHFESTVLPTIEELYNRFGKRTAAEALAAYVEGVHEGQLTGNLPEDLLSLTGWGRRPGGGAAGGGQTIDVTPGWGWYAVAGAAGMTPEALAGLYGEASVYDLPMLHPGALTLPGGARGGGLFRTSAEGITPGALMAGGGVNVYDTSATGAVSTELEAATRSAGELAAQVDTAANRGEALAETFANIAHQTIRVVLDMTAQPREIPAWMTAWLNAQIARLELGSTGPSTDRGPGQSTRSASMVRGGR